ncbi:CHAT domain-containing protein [Luteitalea sp.]|uniref:CHAT domain-containing protein n=1 Tax=Luteitalea sp. TaxID=2004800 RepID=UPI0025B8929A|nr:CHAT domain-containing protein [Luteitalea sp.]
MRALLAVAVSLGVVVHTGAQPAPDPHALLAEGDRLAWLRAWSQAEPQFTEARRLFAAAGDERNALYAEISALRARLPRLAVPEASARLAEYLEHPLMPADDRLRLRCLVIKGETDEDLDPTLAGAAWKEALTVAERLGDEAWANRARGELGLVAFLEGNAGGAVMALGSALKQAQANGDVSSQVRWLTLFGHGYVQLNRPQEALDFYDRALKVAETLPELQFPTMTYVGRSNALIKLGRIPEADAILVRATEHAAKYDARGYQAQLVAQRAAIARQRKDLVGALGLYEEAVALARASGGLRLVADIELEQAQALREAQQVAAAERVLLDATTIARDMEERFLLPRLLAETADLRAGQGRRVEAAALLEEASEVLEGLITAASSPWAQGRIINGMDDVLTARIRLEAARKPDVQRAFAIVEQARARSLLELLVNRPARAERPPQEVRTVEARIAQLQRTLLHTRERASRQRLLADIFAAEEQLAPSVTAMFDRTRRTRSQLDVSLTDVQRALRADEVLVQYALADPASLALVVTRTTARVQPLPGRTRLATEATTLLDAIASDASITVAARRLGTSLLDGIPELAGKPRLLVSPDGDLYRVPFDVLRHATSRPLLDTHVVSYVPSASVLVVLRGRTANVGDRRVLAVSASPGAPVALGQAGARPRLARNVYGTDGSKLRQLPGADDEARAVVQLLGAQGSTALIGEASTETAVKRQALQPYQVIHVAAHGLPSAKFPARAALLVQPDAVEDGLLQAREILSFRLSAALVTLSACDTGSGSVHGQDGAATLVRPFIAAGARSVVANLWAADDTFSLALMREFYRRLATGADVATALRGAKRHMLATFGPHATPRLWSGVLVYGDGRARVAPRPATTKGN